MEEGEHDGGEGLLGGGDTHTHYIEAGLIDLPINYALHLPKSKLSILVLPRISSEKITSPSVRYPKHRVLYAPQSTRHPPRSQSRMAGIAVLVRVFLGKATTKHGSKNK